MPGGSGDGNKGMVGVTTCFAVLNQKQLFVGGRFSSIGGVEGFSGVASYSAETKTWSTLGGGVVGREVRALAASNNALYVVGSLNKAGDTEVSNVAMWSFTHHKWLPMSSFNAEVRAVAAHMGRVFVGGDFSMAGYQPISMVAQIDETSALDGLNAWKPLGGGANGPVHVSISHDIWCFFFHVGVVKRTMVSIYVYIHTYMLAGIHISTRTHTRLHTYIHT